MQCINCGRATYWKGDSRFCIKCDTPEAECDCD